MSLGSSIALRMVNKPIVLLTAAAAQPTDEHSSDHYKHIFVFNLTPEYVLQIGLRLHLHLLTLRLKLRQPPSHSTKIVNYVTVLNQSK